MKRAPAGSSSFTPAGIAPDVTTMPTWGHRSLTILGQHESVHGGQAHIREERRDVVADLQDRDRFDAVARLDDVVTRVLKDVARG